MLTDKQVMEVFERTGGVLKGHFLLTSGRHSGQYMQCAKLFVSPEDSALLCSELAAKINVQDIDYVISPAIGGIIMGYEMSRALNTKNIFAERVNGVMELRRGFELKKGARVLAVEDVVTTGGSVKEVIALAQSLGAEVVAVAAIVDRSGGKADFGGLRFESLISIDVATYAQDECPLCAQGIPVVKPGSREFKTK